MQALDLDPGPRPASTPIPPTMNVIQSRPPSPPIRAAGSSQRSPLSPIVPPKPTGLIMTSSGSSSSTRNSPSRTSPIHTGDSSRSKGIDLPVTSTVFPKGLREYLTRGNDLMVLLLDVRTREEFAKGHIKSDAVVCLEPHVLFRDG